MASFIIESMNNKKKYFRTYIAEFETSTGVKYYAGKRVSSYPDPVDDPYTGSGRVITRAKNKYGPDCIKSIQWFDHADKAEMTAAEIELIAECKQRYGSNCVNFAKGGEGGNTLEFATDERKAEVAAKKSAAQKDVWADPEVKARRSASAKAACADPEVKARRSAAQKEANARPDVKTRRTAAAKEANARPEVKAKISAGVKQAMRTSPVWHGELHELLWQTWLELGMPKYKKFQTHCRRTGITDLALHQLVNHFNERYELEQPVPVPDNVVPIHQPRDLTWLYDYTDINNIDAA